MGEKFLRKVNLASVYFVASGSDWAFLDSCFVLGRKRKTFLRPGPLYL